MSHPAKSITDSPDLMEGLNAAVARAVGEAASHEGEVERLMANPIDILCFGRSGIGKSTLLEALTGRDLGSTPKLGHGTTKLECITIEETLPRMDGNSTTVNIRFWDSRGIDKWSGDNDLKVFFEELRAQKVNPLCILYCATGGGRVEPLIVTQMLKYFVDRKIATFYVVTNLYNHSNEQLTAQIDGGIEIMQKATGEQSQKNQNYVFQFGGAGYMVGVNSKQYESPLGNRQAMNIDVLMELCISTLNEDQLTQFFMATLKNRNFWDRAHDSLRTVVVRLDRVGINISGLFERVWALGQGVREFLSNFLAK